MKRWAILILLIVISLTYIFCESNSTLDDDEEYKSRMDLSKKLLEELNLDGVEFVSAEQYKHFLKRIITNDEVSDDDTFNSFYDQVVATMMKDVPDQIPSGQVAELLDAKRVQEAVNTAVMDIFGQEALDDFNSSINGTEEAEKPHTEDL